MNENTKEALKEFALIVAQFAFAASSFIGTDMTQEIIEKSERLVQRLDKDETIP